MVCDNVRPPLHKRLSCLLGWCFMQDLRCHFISMSGKSPMKLEVTFRHDHSCLLGRKSSNLTKKLLYTCMTVVQCALMHVLFVEIKNLDYECGTWILFECCFIWATTREILSSEFKTRSDTNALYRHRS